MAYYSILSWGVTICLAGAAVYVYRPDLVKRALAPDHSASEQATVPQKATNKKQKSKKTQLIQSAVGDEDAPVTSTSNLARATKKRKISTPVDHSVTATTTEGEKRELPRSQDGGIADKEFAQQLAKAQEGTKMQSSFHTQKIKTQKQSAATESPKSKEISGPSTEASSTTGQDADDDMSSDSPETHPVSGTNISDMLETPTAKPTSLRLTNISDEPKKAKQASKPFEQVLSKKKRNEQAKREEQRKLREESDKIHEAKKQEQLRRARMAEGSSNQSKANAFSSRTNAWQNGNSNAVKSPPASNTAPLLDTFEPPASAQPATGAVHLEAMSDITNKPIAGNSASALKEAFGRNKAAALAASSREGRSNQDWADEMSEEDQIKKLQEQQQEDAWESVTNKKSKKKTKQEVDTSSETSTSIPKPAALATVTQTNGAKTNGTQKKSENVNRFDSIQATGGVGLHDDEWGA